MPISQMKISLYPHQSKAMDELRSGSILCGGVGSGKSRTSIAYYFCHECGGKIQDGELLPMTKPKDLYIITTARKRDTCEWDQECLPFLLSKTDSYWGTKLVIDSWNNISKYIDVKDSFFIFDEQRLVGSGKWVKSFLKISESNHWILLSATPGDTWSDYIPVFLANGFYNNKTEFLREHAVFSRFSKYPKIERYINCRRLEEYRNRIVVTMEHQKKAVRHFKDVLVDYDKELYKLAYKDKWHVFEGRPIRNAGEACLVFRKIVNSDISRTVELLNILNSNPKVIVFYNFDYELDILRELLENNQIPWSEWNGHKHEDILDCDRWVYLVQYTAGAEGCNCVETNVIVFYSLNYSYKIMEQAAGRIDRINTPYSDLYYYRLRSNASIDASIFRAIQSKKNFNESIFIENLDSQKNHVL